MGLFFRILQVVIATPIILAVQCVVKVANNLASNNRHQNNVLIPFTSWALNTEGEHGLEGTFKCNNRAWIGGDFNRRGRRASYLGV